MRLRGRAAARFLLLVLLFSLWGTASPGPALAGDDPGSLAYRVVELANQERSRAGLLPVRWNEALAAAAIAHSRDMAARNYFSHTSPEGTNPRDRARSAGYAAYGEGSVYVGENLAKGFSTPEAAVKGWMESREHRENMLRPEMREIGVGVAFRPEGTSLYTLLVGSRPGVLPVFLNGDAPSTDSPQVTLSITSEEVSNWGSLGDLVAMMASNRPDFAGAWWEPYSSTRNWVLSPEPGPQRVYVRVMDSSGMIAEAADEILLQQPGAPLPPAGPIRPAPNPAQSGETLSQTVPEPVRAEIVSLWPRDGLPTAEADSVNVTARLFLRSTAAPVPADFAPRVLLLRSLNGAPEQVVAAGMKRVQLEESGQVPLWDFNQVEVSQVVDPASFYRFRVVVEGVETQSNLWEHRQ